MDQKQITPTPHDSWAAAYEPIYREEFGSSYDNLTKTTLKIIQDASPQSAKVLDFGAGTGRLAIPLSRGGYYVTAVEPSRGMLEQMKTADPEKDILKIQSRIQDFKGEGNFDFALCAFTVILYILDEESLRQSLRNAYDFLRPGGCLLLDIPTRAVFNSRSKKTARMNRQVRVESLGGDLYQYTEQTQFDGVDYQDTFQIRYWPEDYIFGLLGEIGFNLELDLRNRIAGTGSNYFIFKRL